MPPRIITYDVKYKNLTAVSPVLYSDQNTEVNQIYQDLNDLDAGSAKKGGESTQNFLTNNLEVSGTFTRAGQPYAEPGKITGYLEFQSSSTPPTVKSGIYEAGGTGWFKSTDTNLTMANMILACSQNLSDHSYSWQWTTIKISDGSLGICPAVDGPAVNSNVSCTGVTITSGTATVSTAGVLPAVGTWAVVMGGSVGTIIGKVLTSGAGVFTLKTSGAGTVTGTIKYSNYYRIYTAHAGLNGVNGDPDIKKFTPCASIVAATSGYCTALQGYYLDANGIPTTVAANAVYRILGPWYNDNGSAVQSVLSYKSGDDKDDDHLKMSIPLANVVYGITDTKTPRYPNLDRAWGSGYTAVNNDTAHGMFITLNKPASPEINLQWTKESASTDMIVITVDDTALTTNPDETLQPYIMVFGGLGTGFTDQLPRKFKNLNAGQVIRVKTKAVSGNVRSFFEMTM